MRIEPEEFFRRNGDYSVRLHFYDAVDSIEVEALYQAFKARLMQELVAKEPDAYLGDPAQSNCGVRIGRRLQLIDEEKP